MVILKNYAIYGKWASIDVSTFRLIYRFPFWDKQSIFETLKAAYWDQ